MEDTSYEYDIALSFAGEDRKQAEEIAELLVERNITVFYDLYEQANLWGKDLYQHLQSVYRDKSKILRHLDLQTLCCKVMDEARAKASPSACLL